MLISLGPGSGAGAPAGGEASQSGAGVERGGRRKAGWEKQGGEEEGRGEQGGDEQAGGEQGGRGLMDQGAVEAASGQAEALGKGLFLALALPTRCAPSCWRWASGAWRGTERQSRVHAWMDHSRAGLGLGLPATPAPQPRRGSHGVPGASLWLTLEALVVGLVLAAPQAGEPRGCLGRARGVGVGRADGSSGLGVEPRVVWGRGWPQVCQGQPVPAGDSGGGRGRGRGVSVGGLDFLWLCFSRTGDTAVSLAAGTKRLGVWGVPKATFPARFSGCSLCGTVIRHEAHRQQALPELARSRGATSGRTPGNTIYTVQYQGGWQAVTSP